MKTVVATLLLFSFLWAGNLEKGMEAYQQEDYETALKYLPGEAEKGNPKAQATLGLMYFIGQGVKQNCDKAVKWLKLAAKQNDFMGKQWLDTLRESHMCDSGRGVTEYMNRNYKEALKYLPKEATKGSFDAQIALGTMYLEGKGVKQNCEKAKKWFSAAKEHNLEYAQLMLKLTVEMCSGRKGIDAFEDKDYETALKYLPKEAKEGSPDASLYLGRMYYEGLGVRQDCKEAKKWLEMAKKWKGTTVGDVAQLLLDDIENGIGCK